MNKILPMIVFVASLSSSLMSAAGGGGGLGGGVTPDMPATGKSLHLLAKDVTSSSHLPSGASLEDPVPSSHHSDSPYCLLFDAYLARGDWSGAFRLFADSPVEAHVPGLARNLGALCVHVTHRVPSMVEGLIRERRIEEAKELIGVYKGYDSGLATEDVFLERVDNALIETLSEMGRQAALMEDEELKAKAYSLADLFTARRFNKFLREKIDETYASHVRGALDIGVPGISSVGDLVEENARLKAELEKLKAESEKLDSIHLVVQELRFAEERRKADEERERVHLEGLRREYKHGEHQFLTGVKHVSSDGIIFNYDSGPGLRIVGTWK